MPVTPPAADLEHRRSTRGHLAEQDHVLRHAPLRSYFWAAKLPVTATTTVGIGISRVDQKLDVGTGLDGDHEAGRRNAGEPAEMWRFPAPFIAIHAIEFIAALSDRPTDKASPDPNFLGKNPALRATRSHTTVRRSMGGEPASG
jgi:hypothetical protein